MKRIVFLLVVLSIPISICASPLQEDISSSKNVIQTTNQMIGNIQEISQAISTVEFDLTNIFVGNAYYDSIKVNAYEELDSAKTMEMTLINKFTLINSKLTTMGDFQIYPGLLMEIFLTSSRLVSVEQQLRFEISVKENDIISLRSQFLAFLGLAMTLLGIVYTILGRKNKTCDNNSSYSDDVRKFHPIFYIIMIGTFVLASFALFNILSVNSNYWYALIVLVAGITLGITYQEMIYNKKQFAFFINEYVRTQKPIIGFEFEVSPNPYLKHIHDHILILHGEKSPVHAKVLVDINAKINDSTVILDNKYSGKEPWQVMAYGSSRGHFNLEDILKASDFEGEVNIENIKRDISESGPLQNTTFTISIELRIKSWNKPDDQYESFPGYEYRYDFIKEEFIANP